MVVSRAIVEADGRIRLPNGVAEAAHLEPGQELDITYEYGVLTVTTPRASDDWPVGQGFLEGLMRRAGKHLDADA